MYLIPFPWIIINESFFLISLVIAVFSFVVYLVDIGFIFFNNLRYYFGGISLLPLIFIVLISKDILLLFISN